MRSVLKFFERVSSWLFSSSNCAPRCEANAAHPAREKTAEPLHERGEEAPDDCRTELEKRGGEKEQTEGRGLKCVEVQRRGSLQLAEGVASQVAGRSRDVKNGRGAERPPSAYEERETQPAPREGESEQFLERPENEESEENEENEESEENEEIEESEEIEDRRGDENASEATGASRHPATCEAGRRPTPDTTARDIIESE
ncbi:hypothetical protein TGFOU_402550 [Toxoplasma gondii FOU]|uniref:Uncharacterized protein n=1 Tax=Toxoplasma gondii FOU TaxID=943167 RepID=A0A086LHU6_TOXGO|nr:hypothetical protein TGFOU_402550 [Toxoplasma gondii FOU]